jgi:EmrB/QacA subfamily drug resistance transporter
VRLSSIAARPERGSEARIASPALLALAFGPFLVGVDYNVVNVALLHIRDDLGAQLSALQWIFSVFSLVAGSTVLAVGAAADRLGRRRVFVAGVVWFTATSAVCALAWSPIVLIAARGAQGLGAAMVGTTAFSLIATLYDGAERRRALGVVSATSTLSFLVGPLLGGLVVQVADWRWAFLINVPLGVAAALLAARTLPESRDAGARGTVDVGGAALLTLALFALAWFALRGDEVGWASAEAIGSLAVGASALMAFVAWERRSVRALLPLDVFSRPDVAGPLVALAIVQGAFGGWLVLFTLDMQGMLELGAMRTAVGFLAEIVPFMIGAPLGAQLADRAGNGRAAALGCVGVALGFVEISAGGRHPGLIAFVPGLVLLGFAGGLISAPLESAVLGALPVSRAGIGGGLVATFRNVGVTFGVAGLGVLLKVTIDARGLSPQLAGLARDAAMSRTPPAGRDAVTHAFSTGFNVVTMTAAGLYLLAAVIVLGTVRACDDDAAPQCAPGLVHRASLPPANLRAVPKDAHVL